MREQRCVFSAKEQAQRPILKDLLLLPLLCVIRGKKKKQWVETLRSDSRISDFTCSHPQLKTEGVECKVGIQRGGSGNERTREVILRLLRLFCVTQHQTEGLNVDGRARPESAISVVTLH